jgi:hypothetical protein
VRRRDPTLSVFHQEPKNDSARRGLTPNQNTTGTNGVRGTQLSELKQVRLAGHARRKWR